MDDRVRKAQVRHIPKTLYADHKDVFDLEFVERMIKEVNFSKVVNRYGKVIRSSAWYTADLCNCPYVYSGQHWDPCPFEPWMYETAAKIRSVFGFEEKLDSINFNRYDDFTQSLGFHADNENLFHKTDGTANIVSLSFGASRRFAFKLNFEPDEEASTVYLSSGDLLTMEGRMQMFYMHAVLPEDPGTDVTGGGPRFNATFRYIANHQRRCPCAAR